MAEPPRQLRHRLARDPSLLAELRQATILASVPLFIAALAAWGWATNPAQSMPGWLWVAGPLFALVTLGFLWNVALKGVRVLRGSAPVVEVDTQPWRPGATDRLRIVDSDCQSLEGLDVFLIAEDIKVERVPLTATYSSGWRFTEAVRHHTSLLAEPREALRGSRPFDRTLIAATPSEAAGKRWRWHILLVGRVARGVPREDRYPIEIAPDVG